MENEATNISNADLAGKVADLEVRQRELDEARQRLALPAAQGDAQAQSEIARVDAEVLKIERDLRTLGQARQDLERESSEAEAVTRVRDRERRKVAARQCAGELVDIHRGIDGLLAELSGELLKAKEVAARLARLGVVDAASLKKLGDPAPVLGAMRAAGLHNFTILHPVDGRHCLPLALGHAWLDEIAAPVTEDAA